MTGAGLWVAIAVIVYLGVRVMALRRENRRNAERILQVDQMKKNFISHVSHELKAPLASMQETTHLLLEKIPGPLTDKQQRLLELNLQSGNRLARMIGNILDLSRLEAGTVEYDMQQSDIAELMHGVVLELSGQARDKSLRILTNIQHDPLVLECDPNRMVQLFTNLLDNAVRFSNKGGTVGVQVKAVRDLSRIPQAARTKVGNGRRSSDFALIAISDSGPGIDDSNKDAVFVPFHQARHGKKSHGESLGMGLAISRAVVHAHGGAIWVENNPGGGAVFSILLPGVIPKESLAKAS